MDGRGCGGHHADLLLQASDVGVSAIGGLIIEIVAGNALIGTLFVGLFTLRHIVKLKRAIDNTCATAPVEQESERKPMRGISFAKLPSNIKIERDPSENCTWIYQMHSNAGGRYVTRTRFDDLEMEKVRLLSEP